MRTSETRPSVSFDQLNLQFPPLPQTLLEAVALMYQPGGPDVAQTVQMVERDPIVVTRLLSVVNSAYYGWGRRIDNVRRAVIALGPVSVTGIVMSMHLKEVQTALNPTTAVPFLNIIRHSIAAAYLARHLVTEDPGAGSTNELRENVSTAFTAGLLHDFGKIVLLYNFPHEAAELYQPAPEALPAMLEAEIDCFGFSHVEAGAYMSDHMQAPNRLARVVALHHERPPFDGEERRTRYLTSIVVAANRGAHRLGYSLTDGAPVGDGGTAAEWDALTEAVGYESGEAMMQEMRAAQSGLEAYAASLL